MKRLIPICCRLVDARPVHRSSRCRQHPLKKLHRRLQRTSRLRIRQVWSVSHTVCVILCCSASVTWVCVFHQSCSGSCGCAAENESMDRPSHRQPLGFRRRPETCQSTHQRGKDTHTHRLRYITSEDWEISRHITSTQANSNGLHNRCCCCRLTSC